MSERTYSTITGWRCDCTGSQITGDPMLHHAATCEHRYQVTERVPTDPDYTIRRARAQDHTRPDPDSTVITRARAPLPWDPPAPAAAERLLAATKGKGRLTYACAWGRKMVTVGYKPDEEGGGAIRKYVPWKLHSIALRVPGVCWVLWTQLDGESWRPAGAMGRQGSRMHQLTHTQARKLILDQCGVE